ncbi:predicted protein [Lichtheimia corymbifera JMRC:FSU:9682]|uniref:Uncharacterized protein n=1 Tax=Lichtheimia corymbifera JMRC:FSU:9682 TaxID=1263082 RepID=A0A068RYG0_9FUNG|nr:predicted protein [Lichtheimia corymbifera JMRC:FSU:9682]
MSAFTLSLQSHHHHDTLDTLASVDMDMDPNTVGHDVADIVNAICESLSWTFDKDQILLEWDAYIDNIANPPIH